MNFYLQETAAASCLLRLYPGHKEVVEILATSCPFFVSTARELLEAGVPPRSWHGVFASIFKTQL